MALEISQVRKTISAAGSWTDVLRLDRGQFDLSVAPDGSFSGTVTVQRRRPGNEAWVDVKTYTAAAEEKGDMASSWDVRAGVKTGDLSAGTVTITIAQ